MSRGVGVDEKAQESEKKQNRQHGVEAHQSNPPLLGSKFTGTHAEYLGIC